MVMLYPIIDYNQEVHLVSGKEMRRARGSGAAIILRFIVDKDE